ncbi:MAG: Type 1 glutamine amidotransferase-like domain-containing protein [Butyrivibrio crossotus]|nr:Type 1 glutamine amidotransferase-like domain-containing protein [Butyrivibrio crossotus]
MKNKLIFTSYGLTTKEGQKLIGKELGSYELEDKKIFLFHEPHYYTESILVMACVNLGFKEENIILSGHQMSNQEVLECDIYYCGEGNTFEELSILRERGLDSIIKEGFKTGNKIYIGCSAGAAIAGVSVEEIKDFDKNNVILATAMGLKINTKVFFQYQTKRVW